nr:MAG TPA: hypothetical protein [Bacteriophage sp.]
MRPLLSSYNVVIYPLRGCRRYLLAALTPEQTQRRARPCQPGPGYIRIVPPPSLAHQLTSGRGSTYH